MSEDMYYLKSSAYINDILSILILHLYTKIKLSMYDIFGCYIKRVTFFCYTILFFQLRWCRARDLFGHDTIAV